MVEILSQFARQTVIRKRQNSVPMDLVVFTWFGRTKDPTTTETSISTTSPAMDLSSFRNRMEKFYIVIPAKTVVKRNRVSSMTVLVMPSMPSWFMSMPKSSSILGNKGSPK